MKMKTRNYNNVSEMIKIINDFKTVDEGIEFLKKYDNKSIRYFINAYYNKDFTFMRGELEHLYTKEPVGFEFSTIAKESKKLDTILMIGERNEKTIRLAKLALKEIPKDDADLIKHSLFNNQHVQLNKKVFKAVYPEFFRLESKNKENKESAQ